MEEITLTGSLNICVRGLVIDVFSMFNLRRRFEHK